MTPVVLPGYKLDHGQWVAGWCIYFTPTDPETSPMQWRATEEKAARLAARIERRQERDRQYAAKALQACGGEA